MFAYNMDAGMAELADAHGSGPCGSNTMRVQVSFPALYKTRTGADLLSLLLPSGSLFFDGAVLDRRVDKGVYPLICIQHDRNKYCGSY